LLILTPAYTFPPKIKKAALAKTNAAKSYIFSEIVNRLRTEFGKAVLPATALDHLFIFRYLIQRLIADFFPETSKINLNQMLWRNCDSTLAPSFAGRL
jgi:hypothetical protein